MATGIDCTVTIDGVRLPDGHPADNPADPTGLSGLQIVWGRETTVDQPDASTCTFEVLDNPGGHSFAETLKTGLPVTVTAGGTMYPEPDVSTIVDGGFEAGVVNSTPPAIVSGCVATISKARPKTGAQSLRLQGKRGTTARVVIPPDAFSADPAAWDTIPSTSAGERWAYSVDVWLAAGATASARPALFADTSGRPGTVESVTPVTTITAAESGWVTLEASFLPTIANVWVGVDIRVTNIGPRWIDVAGTWAEQPGTWNGFAVAFVDNVAVLAPADGVRYDVLAFAGRITDLVAAWDDGAGAPVISVTAADFSADLENAKVGDEPWPVEAMSTRFARILAAANLGVTSIIDPTVGSILVSYQDVDSSAALGLLQDLATSTDAVLWPAVHATTGPYLHVEDPAQRSSLYRLQQNTDGSIVIVAAGSSTAALDVSACDVLRDPVDWEQSVSDVTTRASIGWLEQGVDDAGATTTTDRTYTTIDKTLERRYGVRGFSVSTLLQARLDAQNVATRILARTSVTDWRAVGLTIDDDDSLEAADSTATAMLLQLLDGTRRIGQPIRLVDLPDWTPGGVEVPVFLEGGSYAYIDGTWTLELTVSSASAYGAAIVWNQAPTSYLWNEFDPAISWADLLGVGAPATMKGSNPNG